MTDVRYYFDPSCSWAWITSRWLTQVADAGLAKIEWRMLSLEVRDGGELSPGIPPALREVALASRELSRRATRVMAALGEDHAAIGRLYAEIGYRLFVPGRPPTTPSPALFTDAMAAAGIDRDLDRPSWDAAVRESTEEILKLAGESAVSPTLVIGSQVVYGPVLAAVPDDAVALWHVVDQPELIELRRPSRLPVFPDTRLSD